MHWEAQIQLYNDETIIQSANNSQIHDPKKFTVQVYIINLNCIVYYYLMLRN